MKNYKFLQLLRALSPSEFKDFGYYADSPLFNNNDKLVKLSLLVKNNYPDFNSPELTKENIFSALYSGEKYNDQKLRKRFSEMDKLIESYLSFIEYKTNPFDSRIYLLNQLKKRDLENIFEAEMQSADKELESLKCRDEEYFYNKYILEIIRRKFYENKIPTGKRDKIYGEIAGEVDNIVSTFMIILLREYHMLLNRKSIVKFEYKIKLLNTMIEFLTIESPDIENIIVIKIFLEFLKIYAEGKDEKLYRTLKKLLDENRDKLKPEDYKFLSIELYNYCKDRQASGDKQYGAISFGLMKDMLEKNVFFEEDGYMSDHTYINLAAAGLRVKETEWTEKFIRDYKNKIYPEVKENAYNYVNSILHYMKAYDLESPELKRKQYDMSLDYLKKVKVNDFYWTTRIKNHELKIYIETEQTETAIYLIDSYRHYLAKNKLIPEELRERYYNYIYNTEKLIKLKTGRTHETPETLRGIVSKCERMENKGWVLEQIQRFKDGKMKR